MNSTLLMTREGAKQFALSVNTALKRGGKKIKAKHLPTAHMFGIHDESEIVFPDWVTITDNLFRMDITGPLIGTPSFITRIMGIPTITDYMAALDYFEAADPDRNIALRVHTPGGEAALAFQFAERIHEFGDRIHGYASGQCESGGMLILQACGTRSTHDSTVLGSIGAQVTLDISDDNDADYIVVRAEESKNKNTRVAAEDLANQTGAKFLDYLENFTGLDRSAFIEAGNAGSSIMGDQALTVGWVDRVETFASFIDSLEGTGDANASNSATANNGQNNQGNEMTQFTKAQVASAVTEATRRGIEQGKAMANGTAAPETPEGGEQAPAGTQAPAAGVQAPAAGDGVSSISGADMADRFTRLMAHKNGANLEAVKRFAMQNISIETALENMDLIAPVAGVSTEPQGATEAPAPAPAVETEEQTVERLAGNVLRTVVSGIRAGEEGTQDSGNGSSPRVKPVNNQTGGGTSANANQVLSMDEADIQEAITAANLRRG